MNTKRYLLLAAMVATLTTGAVFAQGPGGFRGPGGRGGIQAIVHLKEQLGLSDKQVDKITKVISESQKDIQKQRIELQRIQLDIREELLNKEPSLKKIKDSIDKKVKILGDMEFARIKRDLEIKSILTDEQFEKLETLRHMGHHRPPSGERGKSDKQNKRGRR